jgi:hypothetical protein
MNQSLGELIARLDESSSLSDSQRQSFRLACSVIADATPDELAELFRALLRHCDDPARVDPRLVDPILAELVLCQRRSGEVIDEWLRSRIVLLYNKLGSSSTCRWRLLQHLATAGGCDDLRVFADLMASSPPRGERGAAQALVPLFQRRDYDPSVLFPDLLRGLQHVHLAAPILDLCNYLVRAALVTRHPAADRGHELIELLGQLVQRLACLEERPTVSSETETSLREQVDEGIAIVVALCDALAWIGDRGAVGKLFQALELGHRRIRTEAAAALARLGESRGVDALVELAAEPVARLRVLATARELGISAKIAPEYTTDVARAESLVALELSQPAYFGLPPSRLELIDSRTQYWPGYSDPIDCYLFRYSYRFAEAEYSNIAVAGPVVHAMMADLNDLSPDDIYAAYAGWDVEDEDIYTISLEQASDVVRVEAGPFERKLRDAGYSVVESVDIGRFFGERVLVARAARGGTSGTVVVDARSVQWYPAHARRHSIGPREAFCIYVGRQLLRFFNR